MNSNFYSTYHDRRFLFFSSVKKVYPFIYCLCQIMKEVQCSYKYCIIFAYRYMLKMGAVQQTRRSLG